MTVHRRLGAAVVFACLLTAPPADAASGTHTLDGQRRKSATYTGTLNSPVIPYGAMASTDPTVPALDDCDPDQSCDTRELRLALPRRVTVGRFSAVVTVTSQVNAALVLYDSAKKKLHIDEVWRPRAGETVPECCPEGASYVLEIFVERLRPGRYTLALVDRAGMGNFQASIGWVAHPPDRR